ncbi:MAG: trypsin-like peptidase domain-containing protein [Rhodospirillaceae bacterium]
MGGLVPAQAQTPDKVTPNSRAEVTLSFAPVVKRVAPAVVNIFSRREVVSQQQRVGPFSDPLFRRFFGDRFGMGGMPRKRLEQSLGSGVIVDPAGIVVTNAHVIGSAEADITVVLADRREFDAIVLGVDERTDLAVLRIEVGEDLPALPPRSIEDLEVGDLVIALGNPFGVGRTVTMGIVSALARTTAGVSDYRFFVQTDAAINPGNSGGALVDGQGRLVGINTAIYSNSGGSVGIGFAIPSEMVRVVLQGVLNSGKVVRPWFGAEGRTVTADLADAMGMDRPTGVLVETVDPRGPAAEAGLQVGDVVLSFNDRLTDDVDSLRYMIATGDLSAGPARLLVREGRGGGLKTLTVRLGPPPEDPPRQTTTLSGPNPLAGATVANLNPALGEEIGLQKLINGVIVLDVPQASIAARAGLEQGDLVRGLNGVDIHSVDDLLPLLRERLPRWGIVLEREGRLVQYRYGG